MIGALIEVVTHDPSVTAATNAVWGGVGLCLAFGLHLLVKYRGDELPGYVVESMKWARLPGLCTFGHRLYWNIGIFFAPEGSTYHPFIVEHRGWLAVLVAGIVIGTYKSVRPFLDENTHGPVLCASAAFLTASAITAAILAL